MWNKSAFCFSFFINLCQIVASSSLYDIGKDFNLTKIAYRNVSDEAIMALLEQATKLVESSWEKPRTEEVRRLEEKNILAELHDIDERSQSNVKLSEMIKNAVLGKRRVKRQGVGKFSQAAKVNNLKILRIYLTLFKNLWSKSYVGGAHPFHKDVPKPVVILFKQRIMEFFFPPIGADAMKSD